MKRFTAQIKAIVFAVIFSTYNLSFAVPNVILFGMPGSGKGTISQHLKEKHNYYHICPGDLFRKEIREQTPFGKKIQSIVKKADYVDDVTTFNYLKTHIDSAIAKNTPIILDGYPRSDKAAALLSRYLKDKGIAANTHIIYISAPEQLVKDRILNRVVCNNCKTVYNKKFNKPKEAGVCKCGNKLKVRPQDTKEIVQKRLNHFNKVQKPLYHKLKKNMTTYEIDSNTDKSTLLATISNYIKSV